jgi:nucleotide-binding universal stress UspA family protein
MLTTTIVPLDGEKKSEAVVPPVAGIAKSTGGRLVLLTVLNPKELKAPSGERFTLSTRKDEVRDRTKFVGPAAGAAGRPAGTPDAATLPEESQTTAESHSKASLNTLTAARLYLEDIAETLREAGIKVDVQVAEGEPVPQILDAVEREHADAIALATHHSSALARRFTGSVTDKVVRESPVPVLSMHAGEKQDVTIKPRAPGTVIVPLDGSELSETALEPAWELAEGLGAEIVFVRSVSGLQDMAWSTNETVPSIAVSEVEREMKEQEAVDEYLDGFMKEASSRGLKARGRNVVGPPAEMIISEAQSHQDSVIVMSTHGSSGLKRALLGSVTDEVVRRSERLVLVIGAGIPEAGDSD